VGPHIMRGGFFLSLERPQASDQESGLLFTKISIIVKDLMNLEKFFTSCYSIIMNHGN
jgi:hypothetical protein